MSISTPYRRNAVRPVACIADGWAVIRRQYWLFFAMALVAVMIASAVPMGILMGPMMCGLHLTYFKLRRGEPIEFGTLFKGFDYFGNSVVAALLQTIPVIAVLIPAYFLFYIGMFVSVAALGDDPGPAGVIGVLLSFAFIFLVVMLIIVVLTIGFTFSFPLIVDRKMPGFDAVKLSFKAAMANFLGLLGMVILCALMNTVGVMLCYVGVFFTLPISYAAIAAAYEQVFGLAEPRDIAPNLPPPPPKFE